MTTRHFCKLTKYYNNTAIVTVIFTVFSCISLYTTYSVSILFTYNALFYPAVIILHKKNGPIISSCLCVHTHSFVYSFLVLFPPNSMIRLATVEFCVQ